MIHPHFCIEKFEMTAPLQGPSPDKSALKKACYAKDETTCLILLCAETVKMALSKHIEFIRKSKKIKLLEKKDH